MEKTKAVSLCGFQQEKILAEVNSKLYNPGLSDVTEGDQSQPELPTKTEQIGSVSLKPFLVSILEELPSTSNRDEPKTEDPNSDSKFNCPICGKGFSTQKAMFGHKRIHSDKGSKDFKGISGSKRKSESTDDDEINTDCHQSEKWGATKRRGCKPLLDMNCPVTKAAMILFVMSRSGEIPEELAKYYSRPEKKRKNEVIMEPTALNIGGSRQKRAKKKVKSESHVCDKCGKSFPTGQQLGGHMRAHYQWPEKNQSAAK